MKFDLDQTIPDLSGEPVIDPEGKQPLTMRMAVRRALIRPRADGAPFSEAESLKRYDLAMTTLAGSGPVDLTAEDVVLVNMAVTSTWAPLISGAVAGALKEPLAQGTTAAGKPARAGKRKG